MTAGLRLFTIETRRNAGLWLFPVLVGLAWYAGHERYPDGVTLWIDVSFGIGMGMVLAALAAGGLAAFMAGRNRRRGMSELLATTPQSPAVREVSLWASTAIWGILAYLSVGAYFLVDGVRHATWGGPDPLPILVGLTAMVAFSAIGYAAGALVPSRFVVPVVPVALYLAQVVALLGWDRPSMFLVPWGFLESGHSVFTEIHASWALWLIPWLVGLAVVALAATVLRQKRTPRVITALTVGMTLAIVSGAMLLRMEQREGDPVPYDSVCAETPIPVCVHPAYRAVLDETAAIAGPVLAPLAGIDGAPQRAGQIAFGTDQPDVLTIAPWSSRYDTEGVVAYGVAADVIAPNRYPNPNFTSAGFGLTEVQGALILWLLRQADPAWATETLESRLPLLPNDVPFEEWDTHVPRLVAASERFAALDPAERHAWLDAHFADVRAGRLTLDDLP